MLSDLLSFLDNQRELVIDLQREMTSRPALGPENNGEGEKVKADYLKQWMKDAGITDIEEFRAPDPRVPCGYRPSLIARIPGKSKRTLWIMGHTDVVPTGDLALWATDPFTLHVDGDILQGRGVEDNQQGIVSGLLTAKALLDNNITPELTLGLILVADEETGSKYGADAILKEHTDLIAKDDLVIIPDMGNSEGSMIEVAEKSIVWMKVSVIGKQCHGSRPNLGINSLVAASELILKYHEELPKRFPASNDIFVPPTSTFVPSRKDANVPNINTVPGLDVFYMDCRVMPEYKVEDVKTAFRELADEVENKHGVTIELSPVQDEQAAPPTATDAEIVERLKPAIKEIYGVEGKAMGVGGGTVAAYLRRRGYPCVVWTKLVANAHEPNEQSRISYNIGDAKVIAHILMQS